MVIHRANTGPLQGILLALFKVIKGKKFWILSWSLFKIPFISHKPSNSLSSFVQSWAANPLSPKGSGTQALRQVSSRNRLRSCKNRLQVCRPDRRDHLCPSKDFSSVGIVGRKDTWPVIADRTRLGMASLSILNTSPKPHRAEKTRRCPAI